MILKNSVESTESFTRFTHAMRQILSVSKEELLRREAEYKKQSNANPKKRGPKPKNASRVPASDSRA